MTNFTLTLLSNLVTRQHLTDMETCYKAFRLDALDGISLRERGFGLEPELTAKFSRLHLRIVEVPVSSRCQSLTRLEPKQRVRKSLGLTAFGHSGA